MSVGPVTDGPGPATDVLPLRAGARVAVVAPSGAFDRQRLASGLALLRSWGYVPVPGWHLDAGAHPRPSASPRYLAGSDEERLDDLLWALTAEDIDAVWCARGGYGLTRLLSAIPWPQVLPRVVLGFSDVTALLLAVHERTPAVAVHAQVLQSLADGVDPETVATTRDLLAGSRGFRWQGRAVIQGEAVGPLVGGNLATLAALSGTGFALRSAGALLLLEDVGEQPYRIDRMLVTLRDSGALAGVRGIGLGSLAGPDAAAKQHQQVQEAALAVLGDLNVPVVAGLPFGHTRRNLPFVLGHWAVLQEGTLADR